MIVCKSKPLFLLLVINKRLLGSHAAVIAKIMFPTTDRLTRNRCRGELPNSCELFFLMGYQLPVELLQVGLVELARTTGATSRGNCAVILITPVDP